MTTKEALKLISDNAQNPALNWAINYARTGIAMVDNSKELQVQCLYVIGNITRWRQNNLYSVTKQQITDCRSALKLESERKYV